MTKENNKKEKKQKHVKELLECEEKMVEYLAGWQRAQADYKNLKKESEKEKEEIGSFVKSQLLSDIFPVIDNFKVALDHVPEDYKEEGWFHGFLHLNKLLASFLKEQGVEKIEIKDQGFDVGVMEAVKQEKNKDFKSGEIIKEVSSGYLLNGKVIVPAKVIVAE